MFKLIKWTAIGAVTVGMAGYFFFGTHALSYVSTAAQSIREGVTGQIPIEFELRRAEQLIADIEPQIVEGKRQVAQAEVDLERLENEIESLELRVEGSERKLKTVAAAVSSDPAEYRLAGYERQLVEFDLERTLEMHKNDVALLKGKRALVDRHSRAVAAARQRLGAVRDKRARLVDMIGALKAQKAHLDAIAASQTRIDFDDSALGQARKVLEDVKNRLDVAQKMIQDDIYFEQGPQQAPRSKDIVAEIREYFAEANGEAGVGSSLVEVR